MQKADAYSTKVIVALTLVTITTLATKSYARTETSLVNFNIEQQSASNSIISFAEQADITLLFPFDDLENIATNRVSGWYNVSEGLAVLFARTGLKAEMDTNGQFSIVKDDKFISMQSALKIAQERERNGELTKGDISSAVAKITQNSLQVKAKDEIEVITISGVRGSIVQSLNNKRFSSEIKETISAEDIGQLPDQNIAEALQRITSIQMTRAADGEGASVQIRGISDNNVEINGQIASGSSANRSINFQDIPSELFSGIEVLKVATADSIEGSLGGTINLKTRRPLNIQEDQMGSIASKVNYHQLVDETLPDINIFFTKNYRGTDIGDVGFVFNFARNEVVSQTDVYGGGDWYNAPAMWFRRSGGQIPAGNTANNQFLSSGPFQYSNGIDDNGNFTYGIDVNGNGIVNGKDSYYNSGGIRTNSRYVESLRDSLSFTAQWQPNSALNLYFDYLTADSAEDLYGAQLSLVFNAARSFPVDGLKHKFSAINSDIFLLESGLIGATSIRMGGTPSVKNTLRKSEKISLGVDYQLNDLLFELSFSTSSGSSVGNQAQLNMGYDWDANGQFTGSDWAGLLAYDFSNGTLPNATFYQSPAHNLHGVEPTSFKELVRLDPSNILYEKLSYYQMQRGANDTKNEDSAFEFDVTHDLAGRFFSAIEMGTRIASRTYQHSAYVNPNQNTEVVIDGFVQEIDIQDVNVNRYSNEGVRNIQIANDLLPCFSYEGIDVGDSNLSSNWPSTRCDIYFFTDYFAMHDIRAINPLSGLGYYENEGSRYDVTEDTRALYVKLDFFTNLSDLLLFGNVGVRYVETDTGSSGYLRNEQEADEKESFSWLTLSSNYQNTLPSLNLNLGLNDEVILRFAAYEAISRPRLNNISPRIDIKYYSSELDGYSGTANLGNPNLQPIISQNMDLSYEWYYAKESLFSASWFYKDLASVIFVDAAEKTTVEIGDNSFLAAQPQNYTGTTIQGLELNLQHAFSHFSGMFSHTGIGINYTYTDENSNNYDDEGDAIGRVGLSRHSYNLLAYYDDGTFSVRLAYNWRDNFVRRARVSLGYNRPETLPEIEKARGQLDLTVNYSITDKFKVNFSVVNLNESQTERYMKYEQLTNYIAKSGAKYSLGLSYRF